MKILTKGFSLLKLMGPALEWVFLEGPGNPAAMEKDMVLLRSAVHIHRRVT